MMQRHLSMGTTVALLLFAVAGVAAFASESRALQDEDVAQFEGDWLYFEDLTEGRAEEEQQPPMSVRFAFRVEDDAVVMVRGAGSRQREERISLDGSVIEVDGEGSTRSYRGEWKDGALEHETRIVRKGEGTLIAFIKRTYRVTPDGLQVRVVVGDPATMDSVALYKHPEDIPLPTPAAGTIADVGWISGAWVGTKRKSSLEERWTAPGGGAMLGMSRTIKAGSMIGFEYLRIVERDGGLVYVAQPGGAPPTEFVLTEVSDVRAVFSNPRHDTPQRIVYELPGDGGLTASIGFARGGRMQVFEFRPESD